jgi:hypothetical protein
MGGLVRLPNLYGMKPGEPDCRHTTVERKPSVSGFISRVISSVNVVYNIELFPVIQDVMFCSELQLAIWILLPLPTSSSRRCPQWEMKLLAVIGNNHYKSR